MRRGRKAWMRRSLVVVFGLAAGMMLAPGSAAAQERPSGPWEIVANGFSFIANFSAPGGGTWTEGSTTGTIKVIGWDDAQKMLTWERWWPDRDPSKTQTYTGYLFSGHAHLCTQGNVFATMAGPFRGSRGTGAPRNRPTYGWVGRQCLIS
jgi:hypothetical protein